MTITTTSLFRGAAVAAVAAGLVFIGVQINHPHLDTTSVTTTEMAVRGSLKLLMAVLALAGITGMYLRQVRQTGVLGLIGYLLFAIGYLLIFSTTLVSAYVLPSVTQTDPRYVTDFITAARGGTAAGDLGLLQLVFYIQSVAYLAGGLVFGIALFRARVLARWAALLLAFSGLVTIALAVLPDAFYRLLAYPNGIAMIGLGVSLWLTTRTAGVDPTPISTATSPQVTAAGAE
jgi:hypothetical protein